MSTPTSPPQPPLNPLASLSAQATSDDQVIDMWLHGRSPHTQRAYRADVAFFLRHLGPDLSLDRVTVGHVQSFASSLDHLAASTQARRLSAVKSLLAFAQRIGYTPFNVGAVVPAPAVPNKLAERVLSESEVHRMLALTTSPRDKALLLVLYGAGLRISEACSLTWGAFVPRGDAAQVTIYGKGSKTRFVLLSRDTWGELCALRDRDYPSPKRQPEPSSPVFASRRGGAISPSRGHSIVREAAKRAGIRKPVSPHWLRHAHASHALDRGAPIHLVQATLGHSNIATTGRYLHARPSDSSAKYLGV